MIAVTPLRLRFSPLTATDRIDRWVDSTPAWEFLPHHPSAKTSRSL